jgi:RimJ/RimL family protein N-acetyltransferase
MATQHEPPLAAETVILRDGASVIIRPIRSDDAPRLQALHARLSPQSIYLRFLEQRKVLPEKDAQALANVDYHERMAFVATLQDTDAIIGVARYASFAPKEPHIAEAAIVVEDAYQGRGLGTELLQRLLPYALAHGIRAFQATIHYSNDPIMRFVRRSGLRFEVKTDWGVREVVVHLDQPQDT